jgi:hypothetical protein
MRITLVRDDGKVNTMRTLRIEQLVEQMKVETKAQSVSKMREVLPFMLPGDKNDYVQKVQKVIPAAAFFRKDGITTMSEYNGIVMIQVNNLSGNMEADEVKEGAAANLFSFHRFFRKVSEDMGPFYLSQ